MNRLERLKIEQKIMDYRIRFNDAAQRVGNYLVDGLGDFLTEDSDGFRLERSEDTQI